MARHANIGHTFLPVDQLVQASGLVDRLADQHGRSGSDIERSTGFTTPSEADAYHDAGVTLFTTEIHPDPVDGYDFTTVHQVARWRDG